MLKNYLKIAWRNIVGDRSISVINILGLSLGLACCLLFLQYVIHEWSYDTFHSKSKQIYRTQYYQKTAEGVSFDAQTPVALAYTMKSVFPEVQEAVRLVKLNSWIQRGRTISKEVLLLADSTFFDIFDFPLIRGSYSELLESPDDAVVTKRFARAQFGDINPTGEVLNVRINDELHSLTIKGVVDDIPTNSSIQFNVLVSYKKLKKLSPLFDDMNNWSLRSPRTYLLMSPDANISAFEEKATAYLNRNVEERAFKDTKLTLTNITDIHLTPEITGGLEPVSRPEYSYLLVGITLFILFLASTNFVTLSLGRSRNRIQEVGLRKSFGSSERQILLQFTGESIFLAFIALIVGLLLSELSMPLFNQLIEKNIEFTLLSDPVTILAVIGLGILTGLLSGIYPSFVFARFNPAEIIGNRYKWMDSPLLTKMIVGIQFCLTAVLVVSVITMQNQLQFMTSKDLGFNQEHVVQLDVPMQQGRKIMKDLRNALSKHPEVLAVSGSREKVPFTPGLYTDSEISYNDRNLRAFVLHTDPKIIHTLQISLTEMDNRFERTTDLVRGQVLINQKFLEMTGLENPIGKEINISNRYTPRIAGVVSDFHYQSMHEKIKPLVINPFPPMLGLGTIYIKITHGDLSSALQKIRQSWKEIAPEYPFVYNFLDSKVNQLYQIERKWASISKYSLILGIFIACIGLFGLSIQNTSKRRKELSIRKVLGANMVDLFTMLSKDFLKPVTLGFVIAVPISIIVMSNWLEKFAYRIGISVSVYVIAGLLLLMVAVITISWQSIRAALANPVETLRSE